MPGIVFWTVLTLIGSALPVRLPQGTVVSVSAAPVMATLVLGGPFAAAIVAAIGTLTLGSSAADVPWYGTLFNHAAVVVLRRHWRRCLRRRPDLLGIRTRSSRQVGRAFVGLLVGCGVFYVLNGALAVLRSQPPHRHRRCGPSGRRTWAGSLRISSAWCRSRGSWRRSSRCRTAWAGGRPRSSWSRSSPPGWRTTATSRRGSCSSRPSAPWPTPSTRAIGTPAVTRTG